MRLRPDALGVSEPIMLLAMVVIIIMVVGFLAGGIVLTLAVFFGGLLGIGFFLIVLAGLAFLASYFLKPLAKVGMYAGMGLGVLGVMLLLVGAIFRR